MPDSGKDMDHIRAREKFLGLSLESTRKSYYPQLQKQLEVVSRNERRLQLLLDSLPASISYVDSGEIYIFCNRSFRKALGLKYEEVVGQSMEKILGPVYYSGLRDHITAVMAGNTVHFESFYSRPGGEDTFLEVTYIPDIDNSGQTTGFYVFALDITERKKDEYEREKLQVQLTQAQKMESVGRLAGGVAHDFNNMLSVIFGHLGMMMSKIDETHPFFNGLGEVRKAAERSAELIRQLLAFARQQPVAPKLLDLNYTTEGMLKMLRRLIGEDIELIWLPGAGLPPIMIDPTQVDQILANLCVNAKDAIVGSGRIIIRTDAVRIDNDYIKDHPDASSGDYVQLIVSDNGSGMDEKTVSMLFEPFFTTKEMGKGTGLGLATVYGIVKQNGGFINVYSTPGRGSSFEIFLPAREETSACRNIEPAKASFKKGSETIMMVEDEPAILEIGKAMLESFGYTVLATSDPDDALRMAGEHSCSIDLIITDVVMPGMSGRELVEKLSAVCPQSRHMYMSGYTDDIIAPHGILEEDINFIQKPFSMDTLAARVREVLDK